MQTDEKLKKLIGELQEQGLMGIEAFYPLHSRRDTRLFLKLARFYNLSVTGGSDFHGPERLEYKLGMGTANLPIPYRLLRKMKERLPV